MSHPDATHPSPATSRPAVSPPGSLRAGGLLGLALVGLSALASLFTCSNTTIPAGQNSTTLGLCTYPRGCYVVESSGPNAGQCDDCSAAASCRRVFMPDNYSDYQSLQGTWTAATGVPAAADWQAICGLNTVKSATQTTVCVAPETVCIARGPICKTVCIRHAALAGGTADLGTPAACLAGDTVQPQRRIGATDGGTQTYCPLTDDVCCDPAPSNDGGAVGDGGAAGDGGGVTDGGVTDGGAPDLGILG